LIVWRGGSAASNKNGNSKIVKSSGRVFIF